MNNNAEYYIQCQRRHYYVNVSSDGDILGEHVYIGKYVLSRHISDWIVREITKYDLPALSIPSIPVSQLSEYRIKKLLLLA